MARSTSAQSQSAAVLDYPDWIAAATEEYARLVTLLGDLDREDWARPTDCGEWDVRQMVCHLVGAAESMASPLEALRQARRARSIRRSGDFVDKLNQVQVEERADRTPEQLVADLEDAGRRAVATRRRLPRPVRAVPLPFGPPLGTKPLGYLMGRIYTRDAWLHRVDLSRATGRAPVLTAGHDGRIVADVVAEWAALHSRPFDLILTGPAGGRFGGAEGAERLEIDAVELCRTVSGRAPGVGLLATPVPF